MISEETKSEVTLSEATASPAVEHELLAFPVVNADRKVLGAVDVELYTKELGELERRQESDNLFQLIGVHFGRWLLRVTSA